MKRNSLIWFSFLIFITAILIACGPAAEQEAEEPLNVAFIYVGPVGDYGWSHAQDQARQHIEETYGDEVETTAVESVPEADVDSVMGELVDEGQDAIFATTFGYKDVTEQYARENPDVAFFQASHTIPSENMTAYFARYYQAAYLSGIIAGHHAESGDIGYVGSHPVPLTIRNINAFTLGARSVNSEATVRTVWVNAWHDPAAGREAAMSLIDAGAEVLAHWMDSPAPLQAAEERGIPSFGNHLDMSEFAPDSHLTAQQVNWKPFVEEEIDKLLNGTWEERGYWGGMSEGAIEISPMADFVDSDARDRVEEVREQMEEGTFEVFTGPIYAQDGEQVLEEGETMTDEQKWPMDFFVEGVEGTIPQ